MNPYRPIHDPNHQLVPTDELIAEAEYIVMRTGLVPALDTLLHHRRGRPRLMPTSRGPLTAFQVHGLVRHHTGHIKAVARLINAMTQPQREQIGIPVWHPTRGYGWLDRWFVDLVAQLESAPEIEIDGHPVRLDADEFMSRFLVAAIPAGASTVDAIAVDGTAIETWGVTYTDIEQIEVPSDAPSARADHMRSRRTATKTRARTLGVGPDGRPIYTCDPNARAGYRTATNSRTGGKFVGYELHLGVQARGISKTNYIDEVHFKPDVPNFVLGAALRPAGTHRGRAVMPMLEAIRGAHPKARDILLDAGYTRLKASEFWAPVRSMGFRPVFETMLEQRGQRPTASSGRLLDGNLFSAHLPERLAGSNGRGDLEPLVMPPMRTGAEAKLEYEQLFNERARWRYSVQAGPDADGYLRVRCPFCADRLRSRAFPKTMRAPASRPLVIVTGEHERCCPGVETISAAEALLWQDIPFGTTAWRKSYGRRQVVEGVNANLKCQYVRAEHGWARVLSQTKLGVLLSFSLAGYNSYLAASFAQRKPSRRPPDRPRRRSGTYNDLRAKAPTKSADTRS
jgi:hypothetical protein